MKKITSMLAAACIALPAAAAAPDWGPADTIACYNVGPGMEYTKILYPDMPLLIWYCTIDLTNEYNKIEQVQSNHMVPDVNRWDIETHYRENSRPGHEVKIAWNHDFFNYDMGVCIGVNVSEGQLTWKLDGRSLLAITTDKKAEIFYPVLDTKVIAADGTEVTIDRYNSAATVLEGDCVFFNTLNGLQLTEAGRYIKVKALQPWVVNGDDIPCEVLEISDSPLQTSDTECVIYLRNSKLNSLDGHVGVGDEIKVRQRMSQPWWGIAPENILNAFHGYPSMAHDGVLHEGEYNNFENGRENEESSHVMAGLSKDKTKLYVCLNEMSTQSKAISCVDMVNWMLEHGAWDIVNFDSGGSAAIAINETMQNLPGRGSVRPVEDAMLAVSLAPEDKNVTHLSFNRPTLATSIISATPLTVISYNQYGDVVEENVQGCNFTVEPATLGYVDADGVFRSSDSAGVGKIIVEKEGKTGEMQITLLLVESVHAKYSSLLIDSSRKYVIPVEGLSTSGLVQNLDQSAFEWSVSNPSVAKVEDGILTGLSNGETEIIGNYGDISLSINVKVEIGIGDVECYDFSKMLEDDGLSLSGVSGMTYSTDMPAGWENGSGFDIESVSGRLRRMTLSWQETLYGVPDAIELPIDNTSGAIDRFSISFHDNLGTRHVKEITAAAGVETYRIDFADESGVAFDIPQFPIMLDELNVYFNTGTDKHIALGNLVVKYPLGSGVEDVLKDADSGIEVITETNAVRVNCNAFNGMSDVSIYSATGLKVHSGKWNFNENGEYGFDSSFLPTGVYIVMVAQDGTTLTKKFILR